MTETFQLVCVVVTSLVAGAMIFAFGMASVKYCGW